MQRASRVVATRTRPQDEAVAADNVTVQVEHGGEKNGAVLLVQLGQKVVWVRTAPPLLPFRSLLCVRVGEKRLSDGLERSKHGSGEVWR